MQKHCWDLSISSIYHYASIIFEVHISARKQNSWIWVGIYQSESLQASAAHLHSTNAEIIKMVSQHITCAKHCTNSNSPYSFATLFKANWIVLCSTVNLHVLKIFTYRRFQPFHKKRWCFFFLLLQSQKHLILAPVFQATWLQAESHKQEISCKDPGIAADMFLLCGGNN